MDLKSQLTTLMRYYDGRAPEYEELYYRNDPVRLGEFDRAADVMARKLRDRNVLEIACGTGYWTERLVKCARSVMATDVSADMLSFARKKNISGKVVKFRCADAYDLAPVEGQFDAGVANFWLSHVPRSMLDEFLRGFHRRLGSGAVVFMIDNYRVPGYGGEFIRVAGSEDTFRRRQIADGSSHVIIKNYYDEAQLQDIFSPHTDVLEVNSGQYYWWLTYQVT